MICSDLSEVNLGQQSNNSFPEIWVGQTCYMGFSCLFHTSTQTNTEPLVLKQLHNVCTCKDLTLCLFFSNFSIHCFKIEAMQPITLLFIKVSELVNYFDQFKEQNNSADGI